MMRPMRERLTRIKNGFGGMLALARSLPGFFRRRVTLERAIEEVRAGIARRAETFLEIARTEIYADPDHPYHRLLQVAGCEFGDLRASVMQDGLDATLERLARGGVYLTADEFKGKKDVIRGGAAFRVSPERLERRHGAAGLNVQTSGSSDRPVTTTMSLGRLEFHTPAMAVFFAAHDFLAARHAFYDAVLPASGAIGNVLIYAQLGIAPDRWFARAVPAKSRLGIFYHASTTRLIAFMARRYGPGFASPEFTELDAIVRWAAAQREAGRTCCVTTAASNAVRVARLAAEQGISLQGTKFLASGEPLTDAKREIIVRAGAGVTCRYAFTELGIAGFGCSRPESSDDVHVHENVLALVRHPEPLGGPGVHPLLFTTADRRADRLLLNVANGDYGALQRRDCGCPLERAGLTLHLHDIRSYEKFTGEGMNYFYGDLLEFIERALPAEFGGGPGDYQLIEEEDAAAQTRLTLRVEPKLGTIDEARLLARLRAELGRGRWSSEFQARVWDGAGTLRVEREPPAASARGKISPLQLRKKTL
jgi:hypothetical protein